jgi:hypothetical protein
VITARPIASDEEVTKRVQTALHQDPFLDDSRLTVHVANGVVTLEGIVLDDWDLRRAVRISGRADGVKRVIDDLDLHPWAMTDRDRSLVQVDCLRQPGPSARAESFPRMKRQLSFKNVPPMLDA